MMNHAVKVKMTSDQFIEWAASRDTGRFELVAGELLKMSPERSIHNLVKFAAANELKRAAKAANVICVVYTDGMGVRIDNHTVREPDAALQLGGGVGKDDLLLDQPIIVVEVMSPSSAKADTLDKLAEYASVASIMHYILVDADQQVIVHHARQSENEFYTEIRRDGEIKVDPPGLFISVAAMLDKA